MDATTSGARVLIVDDEAAARKCLATMLCEAGVQCKTAAGAEEALSLLNVETPDAVITDLHMAGTSGMELLVKVRLRYPGVAFLMATGMDDIRVGIEAMKNGADDYLVKPLQLEAVVASLGRALEKKRLEQELKRYREDLEALVRKRTGELQSALKKVERSYEDTLEALGAAIDLRDSETAGHSQRVAKYSLKLAQKLGASGDELKAIAMGAWLHDIGKLAIPDAILLKPGPLTAEEWRIMRSHVQIGYDFVKRIPFLKEAAGIVLTHHERSDGSGYPRGLHGDEVPMAARIFAVADTMDAMTSDRPYRPALPFEMARQEIREGAGSRYDSQVVTAFLSISIESWKAIRCESSLAGSEKEAALLDSWK